MSGVGVGRQDPVRRGGGRHDDEGFYKKAAGQLIGKTVVEAIKEVDAATDSGNAQGPARDKTNPAPKLQPAGIEKV